MKHLIELENEPNLCDPRVDLLIKLSKELDIDDEKLFLYFAETREDQDN